MKKQIDAYFRYCMFNKRLSQRTISAYRIDIGQFLNRKRGHSNLDISSVTKSDIQKYLENLSQYSPRTIRRKIASIKALFKFLYVEDLIETNPFHKIMIKLPTPMELPRTIDIEALQTLFYNTLNFSSSNSSLHSQSTSLRNTAILMLFLNTGVRVSELCNIKCSDFNIDFNTLSVRGKNNKQRIIPISHDLLRQSLNQYHNHETPDRIYFFLNRYKKRLSTQSVRNIVSNHSMQSGIEHKITPHMFRHTFATILLDQGIDLRYIQNLLGHSSITTTQIYANVSIQKTRQILELNSPLSLIWNLNSR